MVKSAALAVTIVLKDWLGRDVEFRLSAGAFATQGFAFRHLVSTVRRHVLCDAGTLSLTSAISCR